VSLAEAPVVVGALPGAGAIAAALVGALAAIAALVLLMRRHREALPLLAILALPFRLPISADGRTVNLLIPLYLVVAAGTLAHLLPRLLARWPISDRWVAGRSSIGGPAPLEDNRGVAVAGVELAQASGAGDQPSGWRSPLRMQWLLFGAVALYALQTIYSADQAKGAENVAFFYLPFALLFLLLRDVTWTRELLLRCLGVAVALAVVFAGIGFVEYYRKALFLNPKVVAANQYDNYFRVNSLFFDPNIYGRFLALVMIAVTTAALWSSRRRDVLIAAAVLVWLLAGLITSFSQSRWCSRPGAGSCGAPSMRRSPWRRSPASSCCSRPRACTSA
jgi:hypothetical protein